MFGLPLAFAAPAVLVALAGLAALYFLLRVTPPRAAAGAVPAVAAAHRPRSEGHGAGAHALADPGAAPRRRRADHPGDGRAAVEQPRRARRLGPAARPDRRRLGGGADLRQADRLSRGSGWRPPPAPAASVAIKPFSQGAEDIAPLDAARGRGTPALARAGALRAGPRGRAAGDRAVSRARSRRRRSSGSPTASNSAARAASPRGSPALTRSVEVVDRRKRRARASPGSTTTPARWPPGSRAPTRRARGQGIARALDAQGREDRPRAVRLRRRAR